MASIEREIPVIETKDNSCESSTDFEDSCNLFKRHNTEFVQTKLFNVLSNKMSDKSDKFIKFKDNSFSFSDLVYIDNSTKEYLLNKLSRDYNLFKKKELNINGNFLEKILNIIWNKVLTNNELLVIKDNNHKCSSPKKRKHLFPSVFINTEITFIKDGTYQNLWILVQDNTNFIKNLKKYKIMMAKKNYEFLENSRARIKPFYVNIDSLKFVNINCLDEKCLHENSFFKKINISNKPDNTLKIKLNKYVNKMFNLDEFIFSNKDSFFYENTSKIETARKSNKKYLNVKQQLEKEDILFPTNDLDIKKEFEDLYNLKKMIIMKKLMLDTINKEDFSIHLLFKYNGNKKIKYYMFIRDQENNICFIVSIFLKFFTDVNFYNKKIDERFFNTHDYKITNLELISFEKFRNDNYYYLIHMDQNITKELLNYEYKIKSLKKNKYFGYKELGEKIDQYSSPKLPYEDPPCISSRPLSLPPPLPTTEYKSTISSVEQSYCSSTEKTDIRLKMLQEIASKNTEKNNITKTNIDTTSKVIYPYWHGNNLIYGKETCLNGDIKYRLKCCFKDCVHVGNWTIIKENPKDLPMKWYCRYHQKMNIKCNECGHVNEDYRSKIIINCEKCLIKYRNPEHK